MDSNDPSNPNSNALPAQTPTPLTSDPNTSGPVTNPPSEPIISDIPQLPVNSLPVSQAGSFSTTAPETPSQTGAPPAPVNSWEQSPSQPVANPWDAPQPNISGDSLGSPAGAETPASQGSAWPSSAPSSAASDVPTAPASPDAANPFLQPHPDTTFSLPSTPENNPPAQQTSFQSSANPIPNPTAATSSDPMNTAFNPTGSTPPNPFAPAPVPTDPQSIGLPTPGQTTVQPGNTENNPWGQPSAPTAPTGSPMPTSGFIPTGQEDQSTQVQPGTIQPVETATIQDQPIPSTPQSAPLDLSSLQNQAPATGASPAPSSEMPTQDQAAPINQTPPQQATPPTPQVMPVENAPTDLSHLIAGDEQQQPSQPMGNIYAPPVAADRIPGAPTAPQTPTTEGGSAQPPEKHLNLTKVLLVAGIPIILIVAALSAYLILGVGKSAQEQETSLPVEQTEQTQAPLTNPPPQIVAPSPQSLPPALPEPTLPESSFPTSSPIASPPLSTPTSAMDRLRAQQSPSPAASSSPAASTSPNSLTLPN